MTKGRGRGFTLHGAAAGAFIEAQEGMPAVTDEERALRIATLVHLNMTKGGGDPLVAVRLIQRVAKDGLKSVADLCTARKPDRP